MPPIVRYPGQAHNAPASQAESRMTDMNEIRERLKREQYEVDAKAVAQVLVERLLAGRTGGLPRP